MYYYINIWKRCGVITTFGNPPKKKKIHNLKSNIRRHIKLILNASLLRKKPHLDDHLINTFIVLRWAKTCQKSNNKFIKRGSLLYFDSMWHKRCLIGQSKRWSIIIASQILWIPQTVAKKKLVYFCSCCATVRQYNFGNNDGQRVDHELAADDDFFGIEVDSGELVCSVN